MFDNELLRAFVFVAEERGFTSAADRLHLTQSAVSAQIKRLEAQTGCPLFTRSTRAVSLTPQGEILLEYAHSILGLHEEVRSRLGSATRPAGVVRIGVSEGFLRGWLADLFRQLKLRYPGIELSLQIGLTPMLLEMLEEAHIDLVLAITCAPADRGEVLWTDRLVWAIAESERVDRSRPVPMCFFPEPCPYRAAAVAALKSVRAKWRLSCVSPSAAAARAAVLLGFGITPLLHSELSPGLRDVGDELGLPSLPTAEFCAWNQAQTRSVAVQQVFEAVRSSARRGLARPPSSERPLEQ